MLQDVDDVVKRVGVLLDDPSLSVYTQAYQMPFIDQEYEEMDVELERNGMQYVEAIAVVDVVANTTDLSSLLAPGQPLASMKFPKYIRWKVKGMPDSSYLLSELVEELDEVTDGSIGAFQWRNASGSIQITPSSVDLTLKIFYELVSTNIFDPAQNVVRGTAHILAARVASEIAYAAGDTAKRGPRLEKKAHKSMNVFLGVLTMRNQQKDILNPRLHGRRGRTGVTAGGSSYA